MKRSLLVFALLTSIYMQPSVAIAAYQGGSSPFALGHITGVEVPRMYSGRFVLTADDFENTYFIFSTNNTSPGGDPVMLLLDDDTGEPIAIDDDYFGSINPAVSIDLDPGETRVVRVVLASFDEIYGGQTDIFLHKAINGAPAQEYQRVNGVRFGSIRIDASWQGGDVVRAVGHYESKTLRTACEVVLGGEWSAVEHKCNSGGVSLNPEDTCELAYPSEGLRFNAVYPHGSRCEKTTLAKDTMILAAEGWSKERVKICFGSNCYFFDRNQSAERGGFDDNSGAGSTAKLVMPSSSVADYPAIIVGLHPWNDLYAPAGEYSFMAPISSVQTDKIRIYRDRALTSYNDPDGDGLTTALENVIGLDPDSADTSKDGIMDGLAVYGADDLPLPNLGVIANQKNIIVELDVLNGQSIDYYKLLAMRATSYALDDAGVNFIALTGEYATYTMTQCLLKRRIRLDGTVVWVLDCNDVEVPVLPRSNATPVIPETEVSPGQMCDIPCLRAANSSFDLKRFPFVRRMAWVHDGLEHQGKRACGIAELNGRFGVVDCIGSTFMHELGHLIGLHHGGHDDERPYKPNYWSVMSYGVELPLPEYGLTSMDTKETLSLGSTRARPSRFSDTSFITLNENALIEEAGITGGYCISGNCANYSNPYTFESIRKPVAPFNYIDMTVGWLDWNKNGALNPTPVAINIDRQCELKHGVWENINTGATGPTDAVCREILQPNDDHAYLANMMDHSFWSSCGNLDAQRAEFDLGPVTTCMVSLPPMQEVGCN